MEHDDTFPVDHGCQCLSVRRKLQASDRVLTHFGVKKKLAGAHVREGNDAHITAAGDRVPIRRECQLTDVVLMGVNYVVYFSCLHVSVRIVRSSLPVASSRPSGEKATRPAEF